MLSVQSERLSDRAGFDRVDAWGAVGQESFSMRVLVSGGARPAHATGGGSSMAE